MFLLYCSFCYSISILFRCIHICLSFSLWAFLCCSSVLSFSLRRCCSLFKAQSHEIKEWVFKEILMFFCSFLIFMFICVYVFGGLCLIVPVVLLFLLNFPECSWLIVCSCVRSYLCFLVLVVLPYRLTFFCESLSVYMFLFICSWNLFFFCFFFLFCVTVSVSYNLVVKSGSEFLTQIRLNNSSPDWSGSVPRVSQHRESSQTPCCTAGFFPILAQCTEGKPEPIFS